MKKMKVLFHCALLFVVLFCSFQGSYAQEQRSYKIFQFPPDMIPCIDGNSQDWNVVPGDYVIGMDQLWDDTKKHPAEGKDWTMVWGCQPWIKELPFANAADNYNFKHGESGYLTLEFWITPFDYAGNEGTDRSVQSVLKENKNVGLCWAIIDYDQGEGNNGFWNLSKEHTMYGDASHLLPFKLMPVESQFRKDIEAQWSFKIVDMKRRLVAFQDESEGKVRSRKGYTSTHYRNPMEE